MRNPIVRAVLIGMLAILPTACWVISPQLDSQAPPPNVPHGMLLLEIPADTFEALADQIVLAARDRALSDSGGDGLRVVDPDRVREILAHEVVTGMTGQELIWVFGCHPSRVRDQGPPGSHTLLWDLPGGSSLGRVTVAGVANAGSPGNYWVRLDARGRVVAAGRN